jgi:Uma2 family endonuclease
MINVHEVFYTYNDYRELEEYSNTKHEYIDGQIFAMTGASPEHERLVAMISAMLVNGVRKGCSVYGSNLRIHIETATRNIATYPDGSVICGGLIYSTDDPKAITNPRFIFEVLSPRTQKYDRNEKLKFYQGINTLNQIMLVAQHNRTVEIYSRLANGSWEKQTKTFGIIHLTSINVDIDIDKIYEDRVDD